MQLWRKISWLYSASKRLVLAGRGQYYKSGAEIKEFGQSGWVYKSLLGFAVSEHLWVGGWDGFCQEERNPTGAACVEQSAPVATWFFHGQHWNCISTLLSLYSWYRIRCFRCMLKTCAEFTASAGAAAARRSSAVQLAYNNCLQKACLVICCLCVSSLVLKISVLKASNYTNMCTRSWKLIWGGLYNAYKSTAFFNCPNKHQCSPHSGCSCTVHGLWPPARVSGPGNGNCLLSAVGQTLLKIMNKNKLCG